MAKELANREAAKTKAVMAREKLFILKNLQKLKDGTGPNLLTSAQPKLFKLTSWGGVE
jgi:hypothetical protein